MGLPVTGGGGAEGDLPGENFIFLERGGGKILLGIF